MRRQVLFALSAASIASAVASLAAVGCGSDEVSGQTAPDASEAAARDGAFVLPDADRACDPNADLFAKVHDAGIGDGASTTGVCLACAKRECTAAIRACTEHCPCQGIVGRATECYLTTQKIGCAGELTSILVSPETRKDALAVLGCVQEQCPVECVVDAGEGPGASADAEPDAG